MTNYCSNCGKDMEEYEYRNNDKCIFCIEREEKYECLGISEINGKDETGSKSINKREEECRNSNREEVNWWRDRQKRKRYLWNSRNTERSKGRMIKLIALAVCLYNLVFFASDMIVLIKLKDDKVGAFDRIMTILTMFVCLVVLKG